jgi:hypothetical protein
MRGTSLSPARTATVSRRPSPATITPTRSNTTRWASIGGAPARRVASARTSSRSRSSPCRVSKLEIVNALGPSDRTRLSELETVIAHGLQTFVEVGAALLEIRDARLYRETHASFDDYCRARWSMRSEVADRTIRSSRVVGALAGNPFGLIPTNESQARALAPLLDQPDLLVQAWDTAVAEFGTPTADDLADIVRRLIGPTDLNLSWLTDVAEVEPNFTPLTAGKADHPHRTGEQFFEVRSSFTWEQREVYFAAIAKAKNTFGVTTAMEAELAIYADFLSRNA